MIATDLAFKLEDKQWYLVSATERFGPYANAAAAIQGRKDKAREDVTATAAQVSRTQQARRERREALGK
jgi:hypothetical protein